MNEARLRESTIRTMAIIEKTLEITAEDPLVGQRVDKLIQQMTGLTRSQVTGLFDHDCVSINDLPAKEAGQRLATGDSVHLRYDNARRYHAKPPAHKNPGFVVVYEDRDLIVVNKPADMLTVPTPRGEGNTLVDRVHEYVRRVRGDRGAFIVHRLDRGVSGLLVFGKTREVAERIRDQFAAHKPERQYVAFVLGRLENLEGEFRSYLATDKSLNRFSTDDEEVGQLAITHYRVRRPLPGATMVDIWLETGRRNQIRVQFAEAGSPVLGDPRYGTDDERHTAWRYRRIALHAQSLAFDHPVTKEHMRFDSQLPAEMVGFLNAVGQKE